MTQYKLIKVDGYWIVVENKRIENPTTKDLILDEYNQVDYFVDLSKIGLGYGNFKKILFSQNPAHNLPTITLSDEVAKEIQEYSWKDVATMLYNCLKGSYGKEFDEWIEAKVYNQCLSDNADKRFTLKDIKMAFENGYYSRDRQEQGEDFPLLEREKTIQSLTKEEYFCELEMELIEECLPMPNIHVKTFKYQPKITNNSVKVLKVWK